jgi:hypothetical protein
VLTAWVSARASLVMARLEPDNANPPRVHVMIDGHSVGYHLGKVNARKYSATASGLVREVPARITTSQDADGRPRRRNGVRGRLLGREETEGAMSKASTETGGSSAAPHRLSGTRRGR